MPNRSAGHWPASRQGGNRRLICQKSTQGCWAERVFDYEFFFILQPAGCDTHVHGVFMSTIHLKVNGSTHELDIDPATPLLYALSDDLALRGPKFGCGLGQCGACTVIVKGQAIRSCITPVRSVAGTDVTTLEGLGTPEKPHPLQQAFIDEQAAQCGFCVSGIIMTAKAFLDKNPTATEVEVQQAMSGVLCRCFTHVRMLAAIKRYAQYARES